jgi:tRNA-dihydrouridine synthase A
MMGWTDRHARYFMRQISRHIVVFGEMLPPEAVLYSKKRAYVHFDPEEHPVVFQFGGNDPDTLARAAREVERAGWDEINLNVGCPSERGLVKAFGAHLFRQPTVVRDCIRAMRDAVSIPVTVKTRIGVNQDQGYEPLAEFVGIVREGGCEVFYIHARNAWLDGLSPTENRHVPPLHYEHVHRLKQEFPELTVVINGGITEWDDVREHLRGVDGVMIGRRAYKDPFWLRTVERDFFGGSPELPSQPELLRRCLPYVERELAAGTKVCDILRHMVGLYRAVPAASAFRRHVAREAYDRNAGLHTYLRAIDLAEAINLPTSLPELVASFGNRS